MNGKQLQVPQLERAARNTRFTGMMASSAVRVPGLQPWALPLSDRAAAGGGEAAPSCPSYEQDRAPIKRFSVVTQTINMIFALENT